MNPRTHNIGESNYAEMTIQPWDIFKSNPKLNYWECDIIKRIMRTKGNRIEDLEKIKHICDELISQEAHKRTEKALKEEK